MTNPNSDNEPEQRQLGSRSWRVWRRVGIGLGLVTLVGGGVGARWAWVFIHERLSPLVEQNLTQTLNRPVKLGPVEGFSLTGLNFGAASVPATATDKDQVTIQRIEVAFDPLELLFTRKLRLAVTLVQPVAYVNQDKDGRWITTQIQTKESEGPIKTELDVVRVQGATVKLSPAPRLTEASGEPAGFENTAKETIVTFEKINGSATFRDKNQRVSFDITGQPIHGGDFRLRGETRLDAHQTNLVAQGQNILAPDLSSLLPLPLSLSAGRLGGNLEIQFRPDAPLVLNGTAQFQDTTAQIVSVPNRFTQANGRLRFQGQLITLEDVRALYGDIPARASGTLHTQNGYNLSAQVRSVNVRALLSTFALKLPISVSGALDADLRLTGALNQPRITGTAANTQTIRVDRVNLARVRTQFTLTPRALAFDRIEAIPTDGGVVTGRGQLAFGDQGGLNFALQGRNLPGDAIARPYGVNSPNFALGRVGADVQVTGPVNNFQAVVQWRSPQSTYPGQGVIRIARNIIRFEDTTLQVAGGTVRAKGEVFQGRWQAYVLGSQIQLSRFSQELRGLFSGGLRLSGSLSALNPAGVRAEGQVRFSEGVALLNRPLTAAIQWNGARLLVQRATAPGFSASGYILAQLQGQGAPAISGLNLDVNLQNYDIAALPVTIPSQVQVAGQADFVGRVTGTPTAPNVAGRLQLNDLVVNELAFERLLTGDFQYAGGRELNLNVAGQTDRIAVRLDSRNRPVTFFVQQNETIAQGRTEGDRLLADLQNFPLEALNLAPGAAVGLGAVGGRLNGTFVANIADLSNPSVMGEVAIARPSIGYINAESFTGRFRYANGAGVLEAGELRRGTSLYRIAGSFAQGADPKFEGQITTEGGEIQDVLTALQIFDFQDFGRGISTPTYAGANRVEAIAVDTFGDTLLNQLRRYSEIVALLNQQVTQREAASSLPDLADLRGTFSGTIDVAGTQRSGASANFSLRGQSWTWDDYGVEQVIVDGSFAGGVLTLLPARLQGISYARLQREVGDSFLTFSGQVGGAQQSGQLRAQNLPVEAVRDLLRVPVDLAGNLDATATLSGSFQNPQVIGELRLADGSLNNSPVQSARSIFGYNNARLTFDSRVIVTAPEPLLISGSIPYRFSFMDPNLSPGNDIRLDVNVRDEGLALLNPLTRNQFLWKGGQGAVQLQARGTLQEPLVTGTATFEGATFSAQALPEPLTNVTGSVKFNLDRIQVESLQGQFSNGRIIVQGGIPIFNADSASPEGATEPDNPLIVTLEQLSLNLKGIYNGGVNGEVVVTGTAFNPRLGGQILLSNGRVSLPDSAQSAAASDPSTQFASEETGTTQFTPELNNLLVTLGDNLLVVREPVLSFVATGDLKVNGTLDALRPEGVITLRSGQVNIFTSQFRLARGYNSRAEFRQSLDPYIDVRLITSALEVTRSPVLSTTPYSSSETADTPISDLGALQTVRIQASVQAYASELFERLELSSSPTRTQNEIIALLGGGFTDALGAGNGTLAIANLASSALLSNVQNFIGNALGLTEFRLFPTTITDEENRNSSLGLAAEVGVDITSNISVSALQILTDSVPTQFNLRYRLSDEFLLRASTNLSGDSRAVLEFQTRF